MRLDIPLGAIGLSHYVFAFLRPAGFFYVIFILLYDIVRIGHIVLSSIRNVRSLPDLFESSLLNPCFYLMKIIKVALVLHYRIQNVLFLQVITDRVILGHRSQVYVQPRNQSTIPESIGLDVLFGIKAEHLHAFMS